MHNDWYIEWGQANFWLPDLEMWVEIKAGQPTPDELRKAAALSQETGHLATIFVGAPSGHGMAFVNVTAGELQTPQIWWGKRDPSFVQWRHCITCGKLCLQILDQSGRCVIAPPDGMHGRIIQCCEKWPHLIRLSNPPLPNPQVTPRLNSAVLEAVRARFEYGATPPTRTWQFGSVR